MKSKLVSFRCPEALLQRLDQHAQNSGESRSTMLVDALKLFVKQVKRRNGQVVPPYAPSMLPKKKGKGAEEANG